jgi:cytochrome c-type biogenesis protein
MTVDLGVGLAFLAGLVSFLSPCVLPIVPSSVAFITGLTLDDFTGDDTARARRIAAYHSALFVLGFSLLFIALGATATALGGTMTRLLPAIQQAGGVIIIAFGLYMAGVLRLPALARERRLHAARRGTGFGSFLAGVTFGAGWTPCIGPILASILLYAGMEATMGRGLLLLGAYAAGLGLPFFAAAVALNVFLTGTGRLRRHLPAVQKVAGIFLVVIGVALVTGRFAIVAGYLGGLGQLINLEF